MFFQLCANLESDRGLRIGSCDFGHRGRAVSSCGAVVAKFSFGGQEDVVSSDLSGGGGVYHLAERGFPIACRDLSDTVDFCDLGTGESLTV